MRHAKTKTKNRTTFEFVLLDSPALNSINFGEIGAFEEHFRSPQQQEEMKFKDVVVFPNLRGDATLVVPSPLISISHSVYPHLAAFIRTGQDEQIAEFWKAVGTTGLEKVSGSSSVPFWLSTSGVHVIFNTSRSDTTYTL
jgi:hypothetical protein